MCYVRGEKLVAVQAGVALAVCFDKTRKVYYTHPTVYVACAKNCRSSKSCRNKHNSLPHLSTRLDRGTITEVAHQEERPYTCPNHQTNCLRRSACDPRVYVRVCVRRRDMLSLTAAVREFCRVYDTQRCRWCETLFMFCLGYF